MVEAHLSLSALLMARFVALPLWHSRPLPMADLPYPQTAHMFFLRYAMLRALAVAPMLVPLAALGNAIEHLVGHRQHTIHFFQPIAFVVGRFLVRGVVADVIAVGITLRLVGDVDCPALAGASTASDPELPGGGRSRRR